jgi:hypothetical protein
MPNKNILQTLRNGFEISPEVTSILVGISGAENALAILVMSQAINYIKVVSQHPELSFEPKQDVIVNAGIIAFALASIIGTDMFIAKQIENIGE